MFTGIIEEVGTIECIEDGAGKKRIRVAAQKIFNGVRVGDSVSVSGVCLTALDVSPDGFSADLTAETWEKTSFSRLKAGAQVNLETAMNVDGKLGGHLVQGHVDATGKLLELTKNPGGEDFLLRVEVPSDFDRYLVYKGSIAIEGISLTIAKLVGRCVTVAIIPHTCEMTNLGSLQAGDPVNIEVDVMAKYFAKWSEKMSGEPPQQPAPADSPSQHHFAVVVSSFNSLVTDLLLRGALDTFKSHSVPSHHIKVVRVPGAYEIPVASKMLAQSGHFDAIVCLGCLIRGDTLHYEVISHEAARGIGQSALDTGVPHAFGVLTCESQEQALDRVGLKAGNKGADAALAAIRMAALKREVDLHQAV